MIRAYHFIANTLRDGSRIPPNREWLRVKGPIVICESGLHGSKHVSDALQYAPGATLCLVDLDEDIQEEDDKLVARCRRIVARFDATDLLFADARASALSVAHLWDMPAIVRQYLETGDSNLRNAARSAAESAAWSAAWSAAESAAWSADWSANRDRLQASVDAKFKELMP